MLMGNMILLFIVEIVIKHFLLKCLFRLTPASRVLMGGGMAESGVVFVLPYLASVTEA